MLDALEDCRFYNGKRIRCEALTDLICRYRKCSFYKPEGEDDTDMGKGDIDDRGSGRVFKYRSK